MATNEELVVQFRAETDQMRREIQQMRQEMNDFVSTTSRSSREYRRSIENMGNSNSEYSRRLRQMKAEQRAAMEPHIEELKRTKLAYLDLGMSMGNYQGSTRDLIREVTALGAAEKKANDAMMNLNRMKMASILQTIGTMRNMTLMADRLKGNLTAMGNPFYNLSRGALTAVGAFNRFAQSGNAAQLALEFVGPNASMKELNDQIRIINTGLIRLQMTALATVASFTLFTAAMWKAAKGPDPADIRKQQQAITDEYNKQYQKRIDEVYNFADLFKKVQRETFKGEDLKNNLKSQVDLMRGWVKDMKSLGARIPVELKEELYKLGPEAAGQIRALSQMSQPELDQYVALWREKIALTNTAVKDELGRARDEASKKIKELQDSLTPLGIAIEKFKEVWAEALKPFVEIWGEFAAGFVNALTKVGEFINKINEINPAITQVAGMILYLASALAVILTPLAVGIGLFKGLRAAAFAVWAVIGPLMEGMALTMPVALGVAAAIAALVLGFKYAYENIEPFRNAINNVITAFQAFWQILMGNSGGAASMLTSLGMSPENVKAILSFGETVRSVIETIKQTFTDFATFMQGIFALFMGDGEGGSALLKSLGLSPESITTITSIIEGIKATISEGLGAVWAFMTEIGSQIAAFWNENGSQIKEAVGNVWNAVLAVIQAVMPVILAVMQVVWPIVKEIVIGTWEAIKSVIQGALDIILGIVKVFSSLFTGDWNGVWEGIKQIWNGALEFLWGYIQLWGAGRILKWLGKFAGDIVKPFIKFWDDIKRVWNDALAEIYVFFGSKLESISAFTSSWGGMIKNFFGEIWDGIVNGVGSKLEGVVTGVKMILGKAVDSVTGFVSKFLKAGENIIKGLIDGISNFAGKVVDKVKSIASSAYEAVTGFFNIHSPSRLMRDVGEFVVLGMIKGIDNMENPAVKAARTMAESVKDAFDTLSDGIVLGDISTGTVTAPAIPNVSTGYTVPASVSGVYTSSFGQSAMVKSQNSASINAATVQQKPTVIENVLIVDGYEIARVTEPIISDIQSSNIQIKSYLKGR